MPDIRRLGEQGFECISVHGEIDASSSVDLDQAISNCLSDGASKILIDLSELTYISSAGLGVFMSYVEEFKEKNIKLVLFGLTSRVAHTFSLLGLSELLEIAGNREEAIKKIHEA